MKKIAAIILMAALTITLTACGHDNVDSLVGGLQPQMNFDSEAGENYYPVDFEDEENGHSDEEGERYSEATESPFMSALSNPLSTFAASPNTASYSNMRRYINSSDTVPPAQSVRIEEFINYFSYNYPATNEDSEHPFSIYTEIADCPWNDEHLLAKVAVQASALSSEQRVANNVVFLIDVSGSMGTPERLPLVKESFIMLLDKLNEDDLISIVTYAGTDDTLLEGIRGNQTQIIADAVNGLEAAGGTGGSGGISKAYELAHKYFIEDGNNRMLPTAILMSVKAAWMRSSNWLRPSAKGAFT
jgi:hypothetical protein